MVGNIGSKSRVNYTVVGDTVNAASRLESLAKEIGKTGAPGLGEDCVVLFSDATGHGLGEGFEAASLGPHTLRGRAAPVEVFRLVAVPPAT